MAVRKADAVPPSSNANAGPEDWVDFGKIKRSAIEGMPPGHAVREAMLEETHWMRRRDAVAKLQTYVGVLSAMEQK